jgi:hypothetical protein
MDPNGTSTYALPGFGAAAGATVAGVIGWIGGKVAAAGVAVVGAVGAVTTTVIVTTAIVVTTTVVVGRHLSLCYLGYTRCMTLAEEESFYCGWQWEPNEDLDYPAAVACQQFHFNVYSFLCAKWFWSCMKFQKFKPLEEHDFQCFTCPDTPDDDGGGGDPCDIFPTIDPGKHFTPKTPRSRRPKVSTIPSSPV